MSELPATAPYLEPTRRTWHMVLGVLGILWGGVVAVSSLLAVLGVGQESQPPFMRGSIGAAMGAAGGMAALMLLVAGIQLVRRRASGVQLLRAWIPLSLLVQGVWFGLAISRREEFEAAFVEQFEAEAEKAGRKAPMPENFGKLMVSVSLACGGVFAVVPPGIAAIFVLGRRGREAVAEWSALQSEANPPEPVKGA